MDKYINISNVKKNNQIIGHKNTIDTIQNTIDTSGIICVYGGAGYGKTFIANEMLNGINYVSLNSNDKIKPIDIIERLFETNTHVLVDDIDNEPTIFKEISERLKKYGKISNGCLITTCKDMPKIEYGDYLELCTLPMQDMIKIGKLHYSKKDPYEIEQCVKECNGNLHNFIFSLGFSHQKDIFKQPKDMIYDLLCHDSIQKDNAISYMGKSIQEHGYCTCLVHGNVLSNTNVDISIMSEICDGFSKADVLDSDIYSGNWNLTPYYSFHGIIIPAVKLNHSLKLSDMVPGSAWTKYNNYKMRKGKLQNIKTRTGLGFHELLTIKDYCMHKEQKDFLPLLLEYDINSNDIDIINHIAFNSKLKGKKLQSLKKFLKTYIPV